jgi:DNA-binding response OmpR family regulator
MEEQFTETEQKILEVFSDGLKHSKEELLLVLPDDLASVNVIKTHICNIRKKLKPRREDILNTRYYTRVYYQHVRLLDTYPD